MYDELILKSLCRHFAADYDKVMKRRNDLLSGRVFSEADKTSVAFKNLMAERIKHTREEREYLGSKDTTESENDASCLVAIIDSIYPIHADIGISAYYISTTPKSRDNNINWLVAQETILNHKLQMIELAFKNLD